jgi:DNA polymerase III delta prime subunit
MHAFLVQSPKYEIPAGFDNLVIEPDPPTGGSIGIDEVRAIQKFLSRKPVQSNANRVYIQNAHLLTIPAQNALLKTLEEPPGNSEIYLITTNPDLLLPTIHSRVQLINQNQPDTPALDPEIGKLMEELINSYKSQKLLIVDRLNLNKESALELLKKIEIWLHFNLSSKYDYQAIADARKKIGANVNIKLTFDQFFQNLIL